MASWIRRIFRGDEGPREPGPLLPGIGPRFLPGGEERVFRGSRTVSGMDPATGRRVFRAGVGFSTHSQQEADEIAERNARRAVDHALAGRERVGGDYAYLADRRAEPVVDVLRGSSGESARISVNGYGSIVMNANAALFADIDMVDDDEMLETADDEPPAPLRDVLARHPQLAVRTYRTYAGWRYLFTHRLFEPAGDEARALLTDLGADEKYVLLCRVQKSFRARLTPKPWRAGRKPVRISPTEGVRRDQLQKYVDATWGYATTRFVRSLGANETIDELAGIVDYHDRWTQASTMKPLA